MRIIRYSLLFLIVFLVVTASGQTLRIPPNTTETSTVTVTQPSNGVISGWGISCGTSATDCAESFLNFTTVTLTATPDTGATFNGWSGACADRGTNTTCTLTLSAGVAVAASFTLTTRNLTITKAGTGVGHVYDADFNVICSDSCTSYSHDYPLNTSVTIHAWATAPDTWDGYSGSCTGTGENPPMHDCTLTMSSNKAVTVTFTTGATFTLYAKASSQGALSTGTCTTVATACTVARALSLVTAGQTIGLLGTNPATDGLYQGANDMLNLQSLVPGKSGTSDTNRITVAAVSDGGVLIDGQYANDTFYLSGNNFWAFQGFDVGRGLRGAASITNSSNNTFRRLCIYHANPATQNEHALLNESSANNLYEDVCVFGYGRNTVLDHGGGTASNVYRRMWVSFQGNAIRTDSGNCGDHPGPPIQAAYDTDGPGLFENIITVYNPQHQDEFAQWTCGFGAGSFTSGSHTPTAMYTYAGVIAYGYDGPAGGGTSYATNPKTTLTGPGGGFWWGHLFYYNNDKDLFIDGRSQGQVYPIEYACNVDGAIPSECSSLNSADRVTVIRGATDNFITSFGAITNLNTCTTLAACPNIYIGTPPGTGSRACFEYDNGTLSSTKLWPWRMDDRIKAALARTSSRQLAGAGGTGYNANTVTSEIVSRYGDIPVECLR